MITLNEIQEARGRFEGHVTETPLVWSQSFSRLTGRDVHLKAECMQRAGSFKIRGALNVLTRLDGQAVVAASAGGLDEWLGHQSSTFRIRSSRVSGFWAA